MVLFISRLQRLHTVPRTNGRHGHKDMECSRKLANPDDGDRHHDHTAHRPVQAPLLQGDPRLADPVLPAAAVSVQWPLSV